MKEEYLIEKWLSDELTAEEREAFKKLDAYPSYVKISEKAKLFKAPEFDVQDSLTKLESNLHQPAQKTPFNFYKTIGIVAAICIIVFSAIKLLNQTSYSESIQTQVAETKTLSLPDDSEVNLSAKSILQFNSSTWAKERILDLEGEAFFKVSTGNKFIVKTSYGNIQVLGTQFNVKSRPYGFEVTCYEGSVEVSLNTKKYILQPKDVLSFKTKKVTTSKTAFTNPSWINKTSQFQSTSLESVIQEFNLYYDVEFDTSAINSSRLYTGSFVHNDLENALKSITLPLDLTYQINGKKVILSKK
ncbi:iron siderophore anti-FecI sigma factor FecR [Psychroflexus gondwanensis ACAM 44]|jgi:ferric-dicitrate binding protein FerR (iron transport regulator)|uniref:Iron siderophore anti-FecI sigma factor FecR n=1 Tax=Psychroflexus gondwanensis ACAM 44 TaxID=1189619 RepID=N1WSU8_9FLAO|nr:FecR family protein [Psychroflexus gondwanensis]EMY80297.1 iron siderophore anti-FecI sigma factor FecR [Psychroflexus gondwanensis ACAM 44]